MLRDRSVWDLRFNFRFWNIDMYITQHLRDETQTETQNPFVL